MKVIPIEIIADAAAPHQTILAIPKLPAPYNVVPEGETWIDGYRRYIRDHPQAFLAIVDIAEDIGK